MKAKFIITLFAVFFLLAVSGFVSATSSFSISPSKLTFQSQNQAQSFTLTNTGSSSINFTLPTPVTITQGSDTATFTFSSTDSLNNIATGKSVKINSTMLGNPKNFDFGSSSTSSDITAVNSANATDTTTHSVALELINGFCVAGEKGKLTIDRVDINNNGEGDDQDWKPLDDVQIEVKVRNDDNRTLHDVNVELGLFDNSGANVISNLDFVNSDDEQINLGSLQKGDSDTATFEFKVPADFDEDNYKLTVKTFSDSDGEKNVCTDSSDELSNNLYEDISVEKQDEDGKLIAFDNTQVTPQQVTCGDTVTLSTDMYNVGEDDQDKVRVNLNNNPLNIHLQQVINNLDEGDSKNVQFQFQVPQNLKDGLYDVALSADYDYGNGDYRESSDQNSLVSFNVIGCSVNQQPQHVASIGATLSSQAEAGKPLTVTAHITNLQNQSAVFLVYPTGYDSWATLTNSGSQTYTIPAGSTKDITFTFTPNEDISGQQTFTVEAASNGVTETRDVAVNIQPGQGIFGGSFSNENIWIWVLVGINVLLIIIVIIVAIRISSRR